MFSFIYNDLEIAHKLDIPPLPCDDCGKYHNFYEIYYFISGKVQLTIEEEKHIMKFGDAALIQPGKHHFLTLLDDSPYERYILRFPDELMPDFLKGFFSQRSAFFPSAPKVYELFEKLDVFYREFNYLELEVLFSNIIKEILIRLSHSKYKQKTAPSGQDLAVAQIIQYIDQNLSKNITVDELCQKFHFSQSNLYKEFQAYMRAPIMKYIRAKKIIAAHRLIKRGEKPAKAAEMFGFTEYSTFYRAFVDVMGYPPSKVKK